MPGQGDVLDDVVDQLVRSTISTSGVSFEGRSLKLNNKEDAQELVEAIKACKELHYLNLAGNTLGVEAAKEVGKALEQHKELKRALWKDLFTGRLKTEIPQALQFLGAGLVVAEARLTELDMSDNAFGPIGVEGLAVLLRSSACYALQELRLNNNGLGIGGGKLLAEALLDCHKESSAAGHPLALKVFVAGRNRLEDRGAIALAQVFQTLGSLQVVAMPQNGIYHTGISAIANGLTYCSQMRELNLNDNTVTHKGAKALAKALPRLPLLKVLNLGDCLLRSQGTIILTEAITGSHLQLEDLNLSANEIGERAVQSIFEAVKDKRNLKQLQLDCNQFGESGRNSLLTKLKTVGITEEIISFEDDEDDGESEGEGDDEDEKEEGELDSEPEEPVAVIEPKPITPLKPVTPKFMDLSTEIVTVSESPDKPLKEVTISEYIENPSASRFKALGKDKYDIIMNAFQNLKHEDMVKEGVKLLMAVCSAAASKEADIKMAAKEAGLILYHRLFKWADENAALPYLNNELIVNLQLLKAEENNSFAKVPWNLEGCMIVLEQYCTVNKLPMSTKDSLQLFLGRPKIPANDYPETKRKLLSALFKY